MTYLLDANVLIDAARDYYSNYMVPEYWDWLIHQIKKGIVKIPPPIIDEILVGNKSDFVVQFIKSHKSDILLNVDINNQSIQIVNDQYKQNGQDLNEDDYNKIGQDYLLIAYALQSGHSIVTCEVSVPSKKGKNRKIPNVCDSLKIKCLHPYALHRELKFSTSWNK